MKQHGQIHIINKYFAPVTAGIETSILQTFSILTKHDYTIHIHTSRNTLSETNILPREEVVAGMNIHRYQWLPHLGFFPKIPATANAVVLENFDIFPHLWIFLWVIWLKLMAQKHFLFVVAPHGSFTPNWQVFSIWTRWIRFVYYHTVGMAMIVLTADVVQVLSVAEFQKVESFGVPADLLHVISNGIESEAFKPTHEVSPEYAVRVKELGKYIVQLSRIAPVKNIEDIIQALPFIDTKIKFVIAGPVGDAAYHQQLKSLAYKLGVSDRVVYWGVVRGTEKFYLLEHAQLMAHLAFAETQCITVWEGLSQKLPCVVSTEPSLVETIQDEVTGFTVPAGQTTMIASKVNEVVGLRATDSAKLKKLQNRGRQLVKDKSWEHAAAEYDQLFWSEMNHPSRTHLFSRVIRAN